MIYPISPIWTVNRLQREKRKKEKENIKQKKKNSTEMPTPSFKEILTELRDNKN